MTTQANPSDTMIRFQFYVTKQQYEFLKKHAQNSGIPGGHALRAGLVLYARKCGVVLEAGPGGFK